MSKGISDAMSYWISGVWWGDLNLMSSAVILDVRTISGLVETDEPSYLGVIYLDRSRGRGGLAWKGV